MKKLFFLVPLISLLLLAGLIYQFRGLFLVALVNNQPLSRLALVRELEKQGGRETLENLILKTLILQEAKKKGVFIPKQEIDQKIAEIEKQFATQGQTLEELLSVRGETRKGLQEQIKIQLTVEKILGSQIKVTDQEVSEYFAKNKSYFPKGATLEDQKEEIKNNLFQQKMTEAFPAWSENLKKEAKISYFIQF